jgi:hypothetical protein
MGNATLWLDRFLPRYDVAIAHAAIFRAPPATCYRVVRGLNLFRHPVIRTLFGLRDLPPRIEDHVAGRRAARAAEPRRRSFRIDDLLRPPFNWLLLAEESNVELVLGQVARPWQPTANALAVPPGDFAAFDRPGFAKIALSLRVQPHGAGGTIFTAETRVAVTDPQSLRRFRRYWTLIGPFSEIIRRIALRQFAAALGPPRTPR